MGFSLSMFFADLEFELNDPALSDADRLARLRETIELAKVYATECGQL